MRYRAVAFDLYETLMTEWGHPKYTKAAMCADLGISRETFDLHYEGLEEARYVGEISFADSLRRVLREAGVAVSPARVSALERKRIETKSACFDHVRPDVYELLEALKARGLRLAIVSNCSADEVVGLGQSRLYPYFGAVVLSYEVGLRKPERGIYELAANRLGVSPGECLFVGDGGSRELQGARAAGMTAVQAKWYTNEHPWKRESLDGFLIAERPLDVLRVLT